METITRKLPVILKGRTVELKIPDYLDANEVKTVLTDAVILWQRDNTYNFCVLALWPNKNDISNSMIYFSRFFTLGKKTMVSHDVSHNNLFGGLVQLAEIANKEFE